MPATWLADALRAGGCRVDESLVPDWKRRGHTDGPALDDVRGVLGHHTAGPTTGDYPSLRIVRDGRPDLAGPLANLGLTRAGVWVPIAAGRAWHAGNADRPASFPWIPNGDANGHLVGVEAESCGTCDDWTPAQREAYPLGVAALLRYRQLGADRFLGHKEWAPSRKKDPAFIDLNAFRATTNDHLTQPQGVDDMTPTESQLLTDLHVWMGAMRQQGYADTGANSIPAPYLIRDVHEGALPMLRALVARDPAAVAAQIPADIAAQVASELAKRLAS